MDAGNSLRSIGNLAFLTALLFVGGLWALAAIITGCASVWWPEHDILKNTVAEWCVGMTVLSSILVSPLLFAWLWYRRQSWQVGSEGITIFRDGRLRRSFD